MTPAELKTMREALGLPVSWFAARFNVSRRSALYWESGERSVPADVADFLTQLDARFNAEAETFEAKQEVVLIRFKKESDLWRCRPDLHGLPVTAHAALLSRIRAALARKGVAARIRYA